MEKISVVVPVYNVQEYLNRCLESIVNQQYDNLEIILVDDGSTDACPGICDEWCRKDSRIRVIHKVNGGLSDARNAGIAIATGRYISFIDSDDYISDAFFSAMYLVMCEEKSDIVECSVADAYENGSVSPFFDDCSVSNYCTVGALRELIEEKSFHQHVWNKLYRMDLVKGILFEFGKLNEDEFWTYQIFGRAKRITRLNQTLYFYFQRDTSIIHSAFTIRRLDALEAKYHRQLYIQKNYPQLARVSKINMYGTCMFSYQSALKYMKGDTKFEAIRKIDQYRKVCQLSFSDIRQVRGSAKKYYFVSKFSFYLCCKMKAILNKGF